jgi:hypothetical protein
MIIFPFGFLSLDSDAAAFIYAANITSPIEREAINDLVVGLKADSLWNLMDAIYPIVGSTASQQKWNLKDPRDLDAAYRLEFNGTWTHSSSGMTPNGTTGYANTFKTASTSNFHLSFYSRTSNVDGEKVSVGARDSDNDDFSLTICRVGNSDARGIASNSTTNDVIDYTNSPANSRGFYIWTTVTSTTREMYKNGSVLTVASTGANFGTQSPSTTLYIGALNNNNTADDFDTKQCIFASLGESLDATQAANLTTLVEAFETTLGRKPNA